MAITHVFKGRSDSSGTFAYIENDQLVVGDNTTLEYLFKGSPEDFLFSYEVAILYERNPELWLDIYEYYYHSDSQVSVDTKISNEVKKQEAHMEKLCEIKVDREDSLKDMVYHLTANGYAVQIAVIWKEFPNTGIDCWQIAIFEKEKK